jgi:hypothetical protein
MSGTEDETETNVENILKTWGLEQLIPSFKGTYNLVVLNHKP